MNTVRRVVLPTRASIAVLAGLALAAAVALAAGAPLAIVAPAGAGLLGVLLIAAGIDLWRSLRLWRRGGVRVERRLPAAFAIGASTELTLGGKKLTAPEAFAVSRSQKLWWYFVLLAIGLVVLEWITYHRRITV